jgi:uncharacterized membrane protein
MDWTQFATFVTANMVFTLTLWLWNRSESRSDMKQIAQEASADRRDMLQLIRGIQEEIKDFHGRLCAIEEKNKR